MRIDPAKHGWLSEPETRAVMDALGNARPRSASQPMRISVERVLRSLLAFATKNNKYEARHAN
jgi:hypothetical protein